MSAFIKQLVARLEHLSVNDAVVVLYLYRPRMAVVIILMRDMDYTGDNVSFDPVVVHDQRRAVLVEADAVGGGALELYTTGPFLDR